MSESVKIGSLEWFTQQADKLLAIGMDVLKTKLEGVDGNGGTNTTPVDSVSSMLGNKLPYILGGIALIGIGVILWKR
jgi:hypothetical protein